MNEPTPQYPTPSGDVNRTAVILHIGRAASLLLDTALMNERGVVLEQNLLPPRLCSRVLSVENLAENLVNYFVERFVRFDQVGWHSRWIVQLCQRSAGVSLSR